MRKIFTLLCALPLAGLVGCGSTPDVGPLKARRAAVLVDGCALDEWQLATLSAAETRRVLDEVVLRCLSLREDGTISPADATSRTNLRNLTRDLQGLGYQVSLAVVSAGDDGVDYSSQKLLSILQNAGLRATATADLASLASSANFLELALQPLPDSGRATFSQWVTELATMVRPTARLGVFAPPATPSDRVLGQYAVDVTGLAPSRFGGGIRVPVTSIFSAVCGAAACCAYTECADINEIAIPVAMTLGFLANTDAGCLFFFMHVSWLMNKGFSARSHHGLQGCYGLNLSVSNRDNPSSRAKNKLEFRQNLVTFDSSNLNSRHIR
mgnify:CR=1 FL=1